MLFASSFIPTYGSTATRGADFARIDGEEFSEFYNSSEHTTVMIGKRELNVAGSDGRLYTISNGTSSQVAPDWDFNDGTHLRLSTNVLKRNSKCSMLSYILSNFLIKSINSCISDLKILA